MNNSYIILNRKTSIIIKVFLYNIITLIIIVIWGINNFQYKNFIKIHSKVLNFNSFYYMEVSIPVKEVKKITNQNQIIINNQYSLHCTNPRISGSAVFPSHPNNTDSSKSLSFCFRWNTTRLFAQSICLHHR